MDELLPAAEDRRFPATGADRPPARRAEPPLTAEEIQLRRSNRRRLLFVVVPAVLLTATTLVALMLAGSTPPPVRPRSVPPGWSPSTDGYFAFAFPSQWSTNDLYADDTGDNDLSGATGWVAEHIGIRKDSPVIGEVPPPTLEAFGMDRPTPFSLTGGKPVDVPGAVAFKYSMVRAGGFEATVIDAWRPMGAEIWLVVDADPSTTQTIVGSLNT
jgi:hypothetical protein